MRNDLKFTPKQRRDLRDRLINSLERRADVWLFARRQPDHSWRTSLSPNPRRSPSSQARRASARPRGWWRIIQEAIKLVGNDDLGNKTRLLYKKVIARFVAELERRRPAGPRSPGAPDQDLGPIDLEFDEANRTFDTLTHRPAEGSQALSRDRRGLHGPAKERGRGDANPPAATRREGGFRTSIGRQASRRLTVDYADGCERLNREKVEMLLLALEDPPQARRRAGAGERTPPPTPRA